MARSRRRDGPGVSPRRGKGLVRDSDSSPSMMPGQSDQLGILVLVADGKQMPLLWTFMTAAVIRKDHCCGYGREAAVGSVTLRPSLTRRGIDTKLR